MVCFLAKGSVTVNHPHTMTTQPSSFAEPLRHYFAGRLTREVGIPHAAAFMGLRERANHDYLPVRQTLQGERIRQPALPGCQCEQCYVLLYGLISLNLVLLATCRSVPLRATEAFRGNTYSNSRSRLASCLDDAFYKSS